MTETTKTIEERVAALETKTTTLSTSVSNAITVSNRAAGSATTANTTANTAKANAGAAQAAATTASAAAAAARKIAEDAALTAEDAFGETADNLKAIEDDIRPALKALQNKDAELQTNIDAIPDVSADILALQDKDTKLQSSIDNIPDVSAQITMLESKDVALQETIDNIPAAPEDILPIPVGESVEYKSSGKVDNFLFLNVVPGTYTFKVTLDPFDNEGLFFFGRELRPYITVEDVTDINQDATLHIQRGINYRGEYSNGSEKIENEVTFDVVSGSIKNRPATENNKKQRQEGYLQINVYFAFPGNQYANHEGKNSLEWSVSLTRDS